VGTVATVPADINTVESITPVFMANVGANDGTVGGGEVVGSGGVVAVPIEDDVATIDNGNDGRFGLSSLLPLPLCRFLLVLISLGTVATTGATVVRAVVGVVDDVDDPRSALGFTLTVRFRLFGVVVEAVLDPTVLVSLVAPFPSCSLLWGSFNDCAKAANRAISGSLVVVSLVNNESLLVVDVDEYGNDGVGDAKRRNRRINHTID
jgi:hypothetical protein